MLVIDDEDLHQSRVSVGTFLATRLRVPPLRPELDTRAFRDALTMIAEMTGQAVAICDEHGHVLYATARARRLLASEDIPPEIIALAAENDAMAKVALWAQNDEIGLRVTATQNDDATANAHTSAVDTGLHTFTWEAQSA